ncbi:hypothetical protein FACS189452_08850 [Bacteroidia bacterium]|nr:hypothetical protein FACS189452_08850 [Bacteroidia bacterium]
METMDKKTIEETILVIVDEDLNKLAFTSATSAMNFKNIKLSDENKNALMKGEKTPIKMPYTDRDGAQKTGNAMMYFDPIHRNMKIEFVNQNEPKQEKKEKASMSQALENAMKAPTQQHNVKPKHKQKHGQSL